jgi:thioredoxin-related protein
VVAVCSNKTAIDTRKAWANLHVSYPCVQNEEGNIDIRSLMGIQGEPSMVLVDSSGKVVATFEGYLPKDLAVALANLGM